MISSSLAPSLISDLIVWATCPGGTPSLTSSSISSSNSGVISCVLFSKAVANPIKAASA